MTQINGIVSGLDTASIVSQLRALALRPVQQLEARQAALQSRSSAWDAFSAKFMDLRAAAQTVVQQLDKRPALVTTSDYTLLGVQVTGSPEVGSHTIRVQALARGQESLSQSFAAVDTPVVGAGTLRLRAGIGADDHDVNGATRLSALNNGKVSVSTGKATSAFVRFLLASQIRTDGIGAIGGLAFVYDATADGQPDWLRVGSP